MTTKLYLAVQEPKDYPHAGEVRIIEDGVDIGPLDPRLDLRNHSPTGFAWGYFGSGPAQLALALLCDATGDDTIALSLYQEFKAESIAQLRPVAWEMTAALINEWVRNARATT